MNLSFYTKSLKLKISSVILSISLKVFGENRLAKSGKRELPNLKLINHRKDYLIIIETRTYLQ